MTPMTQAGNVQAHPLDSPRFGGPVVQCQNLRVRYDKQMALKDVTAVFPAGAVGLLGPNGAGKSTSSRHCSASSCPRRAP